MRFILALLTLFLLSLSAFAEEPASPSSVKSYNKNVIDLMTKKEYPEWNATWRARANKLMYVAAKKVSASAECDSLADVSLAEQPASIPNKKITIWAACNNDKRFFLSEEELSSQPQAESGITKTAAITDSQALDSCVNSVKDALHHPSTFNMHSLSVAVYRAKWGNIATSFEFDAKNSFGLELKYRARCVIDSTGQSPPEINESRD